MHHARSFACFIAVTSALLGAISACSGEDGRPTTGTTGPRTAGETNASEPTEAEKKSNAEGPCTDAAECESGVCFVGGTQSYCSVPCTPESAATDCAAPFTGSCNKQGYCKRD